VSLRGFGRRENECRTRVPRRYRNGVKAEDVIAVLDALDAAGVRHWVGGGWGVAAGSTTRTAGTSSTRRVSSSAG
jgi:hypothetical protein